MSEKRTTNKPGGRRLLSIILLALSAILLVSAVAGYVLRGTQASRENLDRMRTSAVLHAASGGLVDNIARQARADALAELRKDKNFRKMGEKAKNEQLDAAEGAARAEAEAMYSSPEISDPAGLEAGITPFKEALLDYSAAYEAERAEYADIYVALADNVSDWTDIAALESDEAIVQALGVVAPELLDENKAHLRAGFVTMAKDQAEQERKREDAELQEQLEAQITGAIGDWSELSGLDDDALWARLCEEVPELEGQERFRDALLETAKGNIAASESEETEETEEASEEPQEETEGAITTYGTQANYRYFESSDALKARESTKNDAFDGLWSELTEIIPDLAQLDDKMTDKLREDIEKVVWPGSDDFATRYETYAAKGAESVLTGSSAFTMKLAYLAEKLLLACLALLLLGLLLMFWKQLTERFGVPRTIIALFFLYLCLLARLCKISVPLMLGNTLERMGMYGILVLAMMPGIQCGIGLNMGMTIGCISGLMGIVLSLQYNMTGFGAMAFACISGALISIPLGWAYSKLLNRMKGNEMTISTYVGFSFVSLMCIGWMMLPFDNPRIIWLLSGSGLRVTHSLLGSFAHLLDNLLSFTVFGMKVPTGGLLFLGLCCALIWLFTRTRTGIAMTAAGANPRFAEASGINVNRMRTIGTTLSTMIAAVGIVIYSQAFGYAQLYTAPRQLGFIAASAILIGGATVRKAKVSHVVLGVFLFEGVLVFGQQIANSVVAGGGLSEVMRILISNGIILYALTQSGGGRRD